MTTCTAVQAYIPPDSVGYLFPTGDVMRWRVAELKEILGERDGRCWMPDCNGHSLNSMHEAVRRGHVRGWQPKSRRLAIFNGLNTIILCDKCHGTEREPAIEEVADFMADTYGLDVYLDWLLSLKFKSAHPLAGWMRRHT